MRSTYLFASIFTLSLGCLLPLNAQQNYSHFDTFELPNAGCPYPEPQCINPYWTLNQQFGSLALTNAQNHTVNGAQSVAFSSAPGGQRYIQLTHYFPSPTSGNFSVWFYDSQPGQETLYEMLVLNNSVTGDNTTVGTMDFDAYCYEAGVSNYLTGVNLGPNSTCPGELYPQISTTNVPRTLGWHHLEIDAGPQSISLLIDNNSVFTTNGKYAFDSVQLTMAGPSFRPDTVSYWDDFSFLPVTSATCSSPIIGSAFVARPFHLPGGSGFDGWQIGFDLLPANCDFSATEVTESVTSSPGTCNLMSFTNHQSSQDVAGIKGFWYTVDTLAIASEAVTTSCTALVSQQLEWCAGRAPIFCPAAPSTIQLVDPNDPNWQIKKVVAGANGQISVCSLNVCSPNTPYDPQ